MTPAHSPSTARNSPVTGSRAAILPGCLIALAVLAAYANSFSGPFIFDDLTSIQENASIRSLWPLTDVLQPESGSGDTVEGRPILNLSFALNYAISGLNVWSYHAVNIGIHMINALLLLGIMRRTWTHCVRSRANEPVFSLLAGAAVLVWALHPLHTSAITYLSRRAEVLAAFFFLLTLYAFIRGAMPRASDGDAADRSGRKAPPAMQTAPPPIRSPDSRRRGAWLALAVVACLLGVATKEIVAAAPLVVFLYDRTFVGGTWGRAWRERYPIHLALAATWIVLGVLIALSPDRGGTAGFGTETSSWYYLLTQCEALIRYLGLSVWPHPLVFDYGEALITSAAEVWWQGAIVVALLILTIIALRVRPVLGFLGAVFFLLLAPSSSVIPIATQTIAEHRMYLPLVPIVVLLALALSRISGAAAPVLLTLAAIAAGGLTAARNTDYQSELAIWTDTVAKRPASARAHNNLGNALIRAGRQDEAFPHFATAVQLDPDSGEIQSNFATALARRGETDAALEHFARATALAPEVPEIHYGYGMALIRAGRTGDGITRLREAMELDPENAEVPFQLANALSRAGPTPEARTWYQHALTLNPNHAGAHNHLGLLIAQSGGLEEALRHFEAALRARPDYPEAHANLGNALLRLGRASDAIPHLEAALQMRPKMRGVREALDYARDIR